jgi:type IV pilus assembly protein PilY1
LENNIKGLRFIGQSESNYDTAPSPKNVNSLGSIRGLAPEEPTKQGSYYSAASAFFAKTNDLRTNLKGEQTIDSYVVALSSPIPEIKAITTGGQTITVVPFGKSVNAFGISPAKGAFQPTNQIVDFYVTTIANSGPKDANPNINGGRYYAEFLVNFEDVEQGADHDMDVIARYTVIANPNNTIDVRVMPIYQSGSIQQNLGYIISGSTNDGVYLVAKDEFNSPAYFLNVPPGRSPGFCNPFPSGECANLPSLNSESRFTFQPGSNSAATILPNPLWYAAKYGGFKDINGNNIPDFVSVSRGMGLVAEHINTVDQLKKAFGSTGPMVLNVHLMNDEVLSPKVAAMPQLDGSIISMPLEDMSPLLPLEQLKSEMLVGIDPNSEKVRT